MNIALNRQTTADLAKAVLEHFKQSQAILPDVRVLETLFESLFYTSLHTEEGQPIVLHAVLINPDNPDPTPPGRIVKDRWSYIRLAVPIAFEPTSISKIAMASDPKSSSLAVYPDKENKLWIWGLIDQQQRVHRYLTHEVESGAERPGIIEVSILGSGILSVSEDYVKIAELQVDKLIRPQLDVFSEGIIHTKLRIGINPFLNNVRAQVPPEIYIARDHWDDSLTDDWIKVIQRLVIRISGFHHGGALLITPDKNLDGLSITYPIQYKRIHGALESLSITRILATNASDNIFDIYDEKESMIPCDQYLEETVNNADTRDAKNELDGALWFTSVLSRVDGLVVLSPKLDVLGFGAEITAKEQPDKVWVASDCDGNKLTPFDWKQFGTRHRSMMRYCVSIPKSIGIVVSQDGAIRVMTMIDSKLVIWENPLLKLDHRNRD